MDESEIKFTTCKIADTEFATFREPSNRNITFNGKDGAIIGKLTWDGGQFHFEGDADESAKMFFDVVCDFVGIEKKDG